MKRKSYNGYEEKERKKIDVWRFKKYICKVKPIDIFTGYRIIVLNKAEAHEHDIYEGYRTELKIGKKKIVAQVDLSNELVKPGEVGIFKDLIKELNLKKGQKIEIVHMDRPASIEYIKRKMDGESLNRKQIKTIVDDIMDGRLSEGIISAWVSAAYIRGFSDEETVGLTYATVESGSKLVLNRKPVLDKHCIGGVAGNRTTMLIVPIVASLGAYIPKTSSRAITSPAGTADTMEVLAEVDIGIDELKRIVLKTKGAIVWGGGMNLAPVDDKLIKIRNPLSLDPEGMLLASILGKKKSVGAQHVIIDIPVGRGAKIRDIEKGKELARHFIKIGREIGMNIEALITDGSEPIGNGIGPALEAKDVLEVLEGSGPVDLRHKSLLLAGKLLELAGKAKKGKGFEIAAKTLESGKALKKMKEIIAEQGGDPRINSYNIPVGQYVYDYKAKRNGKIYHIDNKTISKIARIAGAPRDKGAGIRIFKKRGDSVLKGETLFRIYAESETKLTYAIKALEKLEPVEMQKILLDVMKG